MKLFVKFYMESDIGGYTRARSSSSRPPTIPGASGGAPSVLEALPTDYSLAPVFKSSGVGSGLLPPAPTAGVFTPRSSVSTYLGSASIAGSAPSIPSQPQRAGTKSSQASLAQANALLIPPSGFSIIEPGIVFRGVIPLGSSNLAFLESFNIRYL